MTASREAVVQSIDAMRRYFRGGERWITDVYETRDGKCLVGAVQAVRASSGNASWVPAEAIAAAKYYIERAVRERGGRGGPKAIEHFNDSRLSFAEIASLLTRAQALAAAELRPEVPALPPPARTLPYQPRQDYRPVLDFARRVVRHFD
jgi:hypothetical protein